MSNESEIEWKVEIRNNIEVPGNMVPILTIHPDGRVIVSDRLQPEKTAELVLDQIKKQWLADAQATKIREQQEHITELEGRLRVLWDKLEGERKHYNERIKRLEDCAETAWGIIANVDSGSWQEQRADWRESATRWRDEQFHPELSERKAKEAKL